MPVRSKSAPGRVGESDHHQSPPAPESSAQVPAAQALPPPKELIDSKEGDLVIMHQKWSLPCPKRIDRVTGSQLIIGKERYRRDCGRKVGGHRFYCSHVTIPKEGEVEECFSAIWLENKRTELARYKWTELPEEQVKAVIAVLHAKL